MRRGIAVAVSVNIIDNLLRRIAALRPRIIIDISAFEKGRWRIEDKKAHNQTTMLFKYYLKNSK